MFVVDDDDMMCVFRLERFDPARAPRLNMNASSERVIATCTLPLGVFYLLTYLLNASSERVIAALRQRAKRCARPRLPDAICVRSRADGLGRHERGAPGTATRARPGASRAGAWNR